MKLYIIRHGETLWNTQFRLQGQTDIQLNEKGRELAGKAADGMKDLTIDYVISSPLSRAYETASIILRDRGIAITTDDRIREIGFGSMEGRRFERHTDESVCKEYYCFFHAPERYVPVDGGESLDSLLQRTNEFLEELKTRKEWYGKNILISTHGAASRALLANITHAERKDFWGKGVPKNCAVSIIELIDNEWKVKELDRLYYENI